MDLNISQSDISVSKGNLYKFPKDVLVKMLTTIEKETIKKCEEDKIREIRYIFALTSRTSDLEDCCHKNCKYFCIYKSRDYEPEIIYRYKDIPFYECISCGRSFCENHKTELSSFDKTRYICNQCCRNGVM